MSKNPVLCLKIRNLKAEMTTTSELEVLMADCILYKCRYQCTRDPMIGRVRELALYFFSYSNSTTNSGLSGSCHPQTPRLDVLPDWSKVESRIDFGYVRPSRISYATA
jgi:hypothetical protein